MSKRITIGLFFILAACMLQTACNDSSQMARVKERLEAAELENKQRIEELILKHKAVDWLSVLSTIAKYSPQEIQKAISQQSLFLLFVKLKDVSVAYTKDGQIKSVALQLDGVNYVDSMLNPFFVYRYEVKPSFGLLHGHNIKYELKINKILLKSLLSELRQYKEEEFSLNFVEDIGGFYAVIADLNDFSFSSRSVTMYGNCLDYVYIKGLLLSK